MGSLVRRACRLDRYSKQFYFLDGTSVNVYTKTPVVLKPEEENEGGLGVGVEGGVNTSKRVVKLSVPERNLFFVKCGNHMVVSLPSQVLFFYFYQY